MAGVVKNMPEKKIKQWYARVSEQLKICFFTAVIIGFAAHLYKITNWLPNWDSLVFRYDNQNMVSMGRWFLTVICTLSSFYDLPLLNGLLAIVFHALGACVICRMFNLKSAVSAGLTGALAAAFPTVTSVMMYNYVADGYAFSFLLMCIAAYFMTKENPNYPLAALFITLGTAIYQAYISVAVMLLLLCLIDSLLSAETSAKAATRKSVGFLLTGAAGMAVYYAVMLILPKIMHIEFLDYQGFSTAASMPGIDIAGSLYAVKHIFIDYFFDFSAGVNLFSVLNIVVLLLTAIFYILLAAKGGAFGSAGKIILLALFVCLLPIGANILVFANSGIDYHNIMKMGYIVFYLFFIISYERADFLREKMRIKWKWAVLATSAVMIFNNIIIANVSYHKLQMAFEKSYAELIRITDRIEQTDGASDCGEILVIGALGGSEAYSSDLPPDMTGTTDGFILRADDEVVGQSVFCSAINDYCAKDYKFLYGERKKEMLAKDEVRAMKAWPDKSSVLALDGVVVLKLGEER